MVESMHNIQAGVIKSRWCHTLTNNSQQKWLVEGISSPTLLMKRNAGIGWLVMGRVCKQDRKPAIENPTFGQRIGNQHLYHGGLLLCFISAT